MATELNQPPYYPETHHPVRTQRPPLRKRIGAGVAAALALLAKLGTKLKLLLVALPKLKLLTTSGSMLLSIGAYTVIWGWQFAIGFVALLFVHEMGHAIQLKREGVPTGWPVFIPLFGAFIGMKRMPDDAAAEARVGLAGPVLGSLGCLVPLALYGATGNNLFRALAFIGFFLNLFNLLPVLPLDGGRAMAALSPWMWLAGFGLLIAAAVAFPNPIVLLIALLGGVETYRRFKQRKDPQAQAYYKVPRRTRLLVAAVYLGLAVALAVGVDATHFVRRV